MGFIKQNDGQADIQAFPGATYTIEGTPPLSQCSEARIEGDNANTSSAGFFLNDLGAFFGFDLALKTAHIVSNPGGNTGDFLIAVNGANFCILTGDPGDGAPTEYFITDGGTLIISRDINSFAQFISAAGFSYTIKGGKLYTNTPPSEMAKACTILFDPLT